MNLEKISKRTKKTYEITNRLFNILNNLDDNMNKYNAEYLVLNSHSCQIMNQYYLLIQY